MERYIGMMASLLVLAASVPYIYGIVKGTSTPSMVSWWVWAANDLVVTITNYVVGGHTTSWIPAMQCATSLATAVILTVKYWRRGNEWQMLDKLCLCGSAIGFVVWSVAGFAVSALFIGLMVDVVGALPTIRNVWKDPVRESRLPWTMILVAKVANLFAVEHWTFVVGLYPVCAVVLTTTITFPMIFLSRERSQ